MYTTKRFHLINGGSVSADDTALCVYRTWAQTVPGRVEFFSSEGSDTSIPIPIVALRNVDDSYPPQKKSFMMLKYMHDHYLDKYEWFMRADDDVYIKSERLEGFLRSLNSSEAIFLGQTGMGARDELGKLALEPGENFCMGGPGVIMSREVLKRMVPHIRECLQEMYTTHEDVEVGRCVRRFAGVQCVWSYEVSCFHLSPCPLLCCQLLRIPLDSRGKDPHIEVLICTPHSRRRGGGACWCAVRVAYKTPEIRS